MWRLIEDARLAASPRAWLKQRLEVMEFDEIARFNLGLQDTLAAARIPSLATAAYTILGFLSDDAFEDFTAWLVLQGKDRFEAALADADSIAAWIQIVAGGLGPLAEWLHVLPTAILEERGLETELEDYCDRHGTPRPEIGDFTTDREGCLAEFPELFRRYWKDPWLPQTKSRT